MWARRFLAEVVLVSEASQVGGEGVERSDMARRWFGTYAKCARYNWDRLSGFSRLASCRLAFGSQAKVAMSTDVFSLLPG
jgi:hypothetical protein